MRRIFASVTLVTAMALAQGWAAGAEPKVTGPATSRSVSQYGITWTFEKPAPVGRFVNGDWYVVGPVTVAGIEPKPADGRNGSVLNMRMVDKAGFDDRAPQGRWDPEQFRAPPVRMTPGDSLVSTISVEAVRKMPRMMRPSSTCRSPVRTAAVLTCLAERPPADAFRPAYADTSNRIYRANDLRRKLLPKLEIPEGAEKGRGGLDVLFKVRPASWNQTDVRLWARVFERPWIDVCFDGFICPVENMPQYGREVARATGIAALLLCCDVDAEAKEELLINFCQVGIDLWGNVRAGHAGWPAHGGHGQGRKLAIVLTGYLLGDEEMSHPYRKFPDVKFSEDMQTMYGDCWTGAKVVYAGHVGKDGHPRHEGWGAYEHLHPRDWPAKIGESYRRCCSSLCWVGEALALHLLKMEKVWDRPAFFDYCDRWMDEDDTEHVRIIKEARGWDFSASYMRQRQVWDPLVEAMWARYRPTLGPMDYK